MCMCWGGLFFFFKKSSFRVCLSPCRSLYLFSFFPPVKYFDVVQCLWLTKNICVWMLCKVLSELCFHWNERAFAKSERCWVLKLR